MTVATDYQPWYSGQTYPSIQIPLNVGPPGSSTADDITGILFSSFTMTFRSSNGVDIIGTGGFAVVTNNPAVVAYTFSLSDVLNPFTGTMIVKAVFPGGGIAVYDGVPFTITQV